MIELKENKWFEGDFCYDIETYRNIFTFCIVRSDGKFLKVFEISDRKNQTEEILNCLRYLKNNKCRMVGFNNIGFDYPIIHEIMQRAMKAKRKNQKLSLTAEGLYDLAQEQLSFIIIGLEPEILPDRSRGRVRATVLKNRPWSYLGVADEFTIDENTWEVLLSQDEELLTDF